MSSLANGINRVSLNADGNRTRMQSIWAVGWDTVVIVEPSGKDQSKDVVRWLLMP